MPNYELRRHKTADAVKWVITFILLLGIIGALVAAFVMMDRQTTVTELGREAYSVGGLDEEGKAESTEVSIVTRKAFPVDGLEITMETDEPTVVYVLYFYDKDGEFLSASAEYNSDYDGSIPKGAESAKIVITPTEDEDGKVGVTEVWGYAGQICVIHNR